MSFNAICLIITIGIIVIDSQRLANPISCSLAAGGICDSAILGQTAATPLATCHLTCHKKHCRKICTTASSAFDIKKRRRMIKSKLVRRKQRLYNTEHVPFDAKENPFSSPEDTTVAPIFEVTPLTISEAELEEELRRMSTSLYLIKHDEQYDDERNEEPPSNSTDTTPFTTIVSENFTIPPTTESNLPPTAIPSTTTPATPIFPTLLPQPPFEPSRSITPLRATPPPALPLPPAPPNILPPSAVPARIISPLDFCPKPPGFEPNNEDDDENEDDNEELPDVKLKKIMPPVETEDRLKVKPSRKKKKKLVVTFSTADFNDLEDEDDENNSSEKIKKKILKPPTRHPTIRRPKISIVRSRKKCPPPEICEPNCGIFLDEDGCQGCQCLWIAGPCDSDLDCRDEGQFCDLGLCNCARGFEYDEQNSGVCRRISSRRGRGDNVRRVGNAGSVPNGILIVPPLNRLVSGRSEKSLPEERAHLRKVLSLGPLEARQRARRNATPSTVRNRKRIRVRITTITPSTATSTVKHTTTVILSTTAITSPRTTTSSMLTVIEMPKRPMREERLQWPGPCTIDGDCPPGLYCIVSDCWALPEKLLRGNSIGEHRLPGVVTPNGSATSVQRIIWTTTTAPLTEAITIPPLDIITTIPSISVAPILSVSAAPLSASSTTSTALIGNSEAQPPGWTPPIAITRAPAEIVADAEAQVATLTIKVSSTPPSTSAEPTLLSPHDVSELTQLKNESVTATNIPARKLLTATPLNDNLFTNFDLPSDKNNAIHNSDNGKHFDVADNVLQRHVGTKINGNADSADTVRAPEIHLQTPSASNDLHSNASEGVSIAADNLQELWSAISDASLWTGDPPDFDLQSNQLNRRFQHSKIFSDHDYDNIRDPKPSSISSTISSNSEIGKLDYEPSTLYTANHHKNVGFRNDRNQVNRLYKKAKRNENSRVNDGRNSHVDHVDHVNKSHVEHVIREKISDKESTGFIAKSGPIITKYKVNRSNRRSDTVSKVHPILHRPAMPKIRSRIIENYSVRNLMRRPVRVNIHNAKSVIRDECATNRDCGGVGAPADARRIDKPHAKPPIYGRGVRLLCCTKRWCDLSMDCGTARFCLPDCRFTKLTHLVWARSALHKTVMDGHNGDLIDLIYD